jgi:hypothetical protein
MSTALVAVLLVLLAYCVAALLKVLRGGLATTDAMLRGGVTFGSLRRGDVPFQPSGSALVVREGMRACVAKDGSVEVTQTRTIARDAI